MNRANATMGPEKVFCFFCFFFCFFFVVFFLFFFLATFVSGGLV